MDHERTTAQKVILWALLAMAVVFTVVNIILKFFPGVEFEDTLLKVSQSGETTLYPGEKYKESITVAVTPEGRGSRVELTIGDTIDHTYRVIFPGGTIRSGFGYTYDRLTVTCNDRVIFDGGYTPNVSELADYCDLDGGITVSGYGRVSYSGSSDPWYRYEMNHFEVMNFANDPETTTRGSWVHYGVALFCSIVCAVAVAFPYTLFELRYYWSVKDPEPTDFYLRMNELSGGIVAVVLLIVYIIGVTKIV